MTYEEMREQELRNAEALLGSVMATDPNIQIQKTDTGIEKMINDIALDNMSSP